MCWETSEYSVFDWLQKGICPHRTWLRLKQWNSPVYPTHIFKTSVREDCRFCCSQLTESPSLPFPLAISHSLIPSIQQLLSVSSTHTLLLFLAHTIFLSLTNTAWRAGLPVVSIFHLDAGDSALPLQFISWITREGHRVSGLSPFPIASAIHRNTWISASCSKWTWRTNAHKHNTYILILLCKQSTGDPMSKSENTHTHTHTLLYQFHITLSTAVKLKPGLKQS